jgi:hypothetical protein
LHRQYAYDKHLQAELTDLERRLLDWLLPAKKAFYAQVRARLEALALNRLPDGTLEFGRFDEDLAETIAIGEIDLGEHVSLRMDEAGKGGSLSIPVLNSETKFSWTLSSWQPGKSEAREIEMKDTTGVLHYVFALSHARRVLWLHHVQSGYNQLIPVTGVFVELARLKRMPSTGSLSHNAFFELAERSSDDVLVEALLAYNKHARKFDAAKVSLPASDQKRNGGFNFFRK